MTRAKAIITIKRGGTLTPDQHRLMILWAHDCVCHVLRLLPVELDKQLQHALQTALDWANGKVTVGEARKASVLAHAMARSAIHPVEIAVARAIGHAVATAHMADHSVGAALYALKAIAASGLSMVQEREWQLQHLPEQIRVLVIALIHEKEKSFRFK